MACDSFWMLSQRDPDIHIAALFMVQGTHTLKVRDKREEKEEEEEEEEEEAEKRARTLPVQDRVLSLACLKVQGLARRARR